MKYIYVDESEFATPKNCIGVGGIVSDSHIDEKIIERALTNLKNDPDIQSEETKELDSRTLKRKYFHASEDSKNAHSHIFTEAMKLDYIFCCDFHDPNLSDEGKSLEDYYVLSFINSLVPLANTKENIKCFVEQRPGITTKSLNDSYKLYKRQLLLNAYDQPFIPCFFPQIDFQIVDKTNPGVQIADLLLWVVNRKVNGDLIWYNRIKSAFKYNFISESQSWGGENITIGKGIVEAAKVSQLNYMPKDPDKIVDDNKMMNFFLHAIKVCEYYYKNPVNETSQLKEKIEYIVKHKKDSNKTGYIKKLARTYLMIFDMVDLIENEDSKKNKEFLMLSKKYLALILREDLVHGVRTQIWFNRLRENIITNDPDLLEFDK